MRVAILAGGLGTRISEATDLVPKPMVEIGSRPILWHVMAIYAKFNITKFDIALGYKGDVIKKYFLDYSKINATFAVNLSSGEVSNLKSDSENWDVNLVDTGRETMTGGRIKRLQNHIGRETFMATYGDGVSDIDVEALLKFHRSHGKLATMLAVRPAARFGELLLEGDRVSSFREKPQTEQSWINGGYFVFEPEVFEYIDDDTTVLEASPLERLSGDGQLCAFRHEGFWQCMDTLRDQRYLNSLTSEGSPPWLERTHD